MVLMVGELYDALTEASTSDEKVCAETEAVAQWENRFDMTERHMSALEARINTPT
jgi:hypothetical protein